MASTTVNFNLKTAGYVNYANQTLTFRLLTAGAEASTGDESYLVLPGIVTATSAANGDGSVTLFRNGKSAIDSVYEVILPNREKLQFIIPSGTSTVELSNLLVNNQPSGSNTQQSSVYDAAIQRANHTGDLTLDSLPNGSITGTLAVANGGTNASSASAARTSLGAQEQKDVLDDLGALSAPASDGQFIVATGSGAFQYETAATARTSLGLGTIATQASNSVDIDGGAIDGAVIGANAAAAITGTTITASTKFAGAIDGTVGATTPAAVTGTNVLATTTLGYKAGSGGTVTQATDKTTAVTLNKINGEIIMNGAALADDATAAFTLTNSTIAATDVVIVNVASVGTAGAYQVTVGAVAAGSCSISVLNVSGGSLSQAIKLNFAVIKAVKA
jgi:hypothetical protein